MSPFYLVLHTH